MGWCFWKNFWKETPVPFPLWEMWFNLHSSWGWNLLSQVSKKPLNCSHFCHFGAVPVLLSHVWVVCGIWHTLCWGFGNHSAIWGSHLGGEIWRKPDQKEIFYSTCQLCCVILKENMMPGLAAHWDLGKLWEGNSFGCEVNAKWDVHGGSGVCKLGSLPTS